MGFVEKARQMADQAQQKLDEAQQRFNEAQRERAAAARAGEQAPVVQYDSAGRPIAPGPAAREPVVEYGGAGRPVEPEAAAPAPVTPPPDSTAEPADADHPAPPAAPALPAEPPGAETAVASQSPADASYEQPTEVTTPVAASAESAVEPDPPAGEHPNAAGSSGEPPHAADRDPEDAPPTAGGDTSAR
jgi:hypothetical protein